MGRGNVDFKKLEKQATEAKSTSNAGFSAKSMCDEFNPATVSTRFSKKGPFNDFRDVITVLVGLDVTGSMGGIPKSLINGKLGSLMLDLKKTFNKPNENLQISFAGIGDGKNDVSPLQVTHFESDNRFAEQLQKIWLEGKGGGNGAESYNLLWWYAANKTQLNYVKQDARKGILITLGDDNVHPDLTPAEIRKVFDKNYEGGNISNQILLDAVRRQYEVYHIIITDGDAYKTDCMREGDPKTAEQNEKETKKWKELLGENNVIESKSHSVDRAIAEIVIRHRPFEKANTVTLTQEEWEKKKKESLTDDEWEDVLTYTLCPLKQEYMKQPVVWNGGKKAYEQHAVEKYVQEHNKDPITGNKLTVSKLVLTTHVSIDQVCKAYKPFFDALPEDRKKRLIKSALEQMGIKPKDNEDKSEIDPKAEKGAAANLGIFAPKPSAQPPSVVANPSNLGVAHLNVDSEGIPERYKCPIDHVVMEDPVFAKDGETYGRPGIERWFEQHNTSPITREVLSSKELTPNKGLKSEIKEWQQRLAAAQRASAADLSKAPNP